MYNIAWQCKMNIIYYTHKAQTNREKIDKTEHNAQQLCSFLKKGGWKCGLTAKNDINGI